MIGARPLDRVSIQWSGALEGGAADRRAGYFELADKGTIFLDEIAEMSPALQAKYLRVLQEGTLRRLGAKAELPVDVRVVAATNKDPVQAMRVGGLREDLFYRLNVFSIAMPRRT